MIKKRNEVTNCSFRIISAPAPKGIDIAIVQLRVFGTISSTAKTNISMPQIQVHSTYEHTGFHYRKTEGRHSQAEDEAIHWVCCSVCQCHKCLSPGRERRNWLTARIGNDEMKSVSLPYCRGQRNVVRSKMWWVGLLSKCVSTGVLSMNVSLYMLCTAFYINMREAMPVWQ